MTFKTLKDHVYNYIADGIRAKKLLPNQKINEQEISDELQISRTPVREALIQLSADGLLESSPRRGFRVNPIGGKEAKDLYTLLAALDAMAAAQSVDYLTGEDFLKMQCLVDQMYVVLNMYQFSEYFKMQREFHDIYIEKTENIPLISTISRLRNRFVRQGYDNNPDDELKNILLESNKQHEEIISMLKAKDSDKVAEFLRDTHWDMNYAERDRFD